MPLPNNFKLKSGNYIPSLGLGTWRLRGIECINAVKCALESGYRHIDTADHYENHRDIARAIQESKIKREEIFITSKVWRSDLHKETVLDKANKFLQELNTNYIDLLLIHWPNKEIPIEETLGAFQQLKEEGKIKNIGVSNFTIHHMKNALKTAVIIDVNQVEFHPFLYQKELKEFCDKNKIVITAYAPLARGLALQNETIKEVAKKNLATESQVVLSWILSKGVVAIPKSTSSKYIKENYEALKMELENEDIEKIDQISKTQPTRLVNTTFSEFALK